MNATEKSKSIRLKKNLYDTALGDEAVLLNLSTGNYFSLNSVAHCIWKYLKKNADKNLTVEDISDFLAETYDEKPEVILEDLKDFLSLLSKQKLIEESC